jgi:large subunit ribosomal protein L1
MHSKSFLHLKKAIDKKSYPAKDALEIIKNLPSAKFDETIELHVHVGIDPKKGDQQIRGTVVLPNNFGASKKVAVFATESRAAEATEAGADAVFTESMIADLQKSGKFDFDIAVAIPDMMKTIAPLARFLGPKGLMPSPKNETISNDLKKTVEQLKKGKIAFKNDDTANVHQAIGKKSMAIEQLVANYETFMDALRKVKPTNSKGAYLRKVSLCSTMGPSLKVEA